MVRLVFVDMDDTFLTPEKAIAQENLSVLDLAYENGVQFVPCTGRNVTGLPPELLSHPSVRYAVCCNGALICDVGTHEVLREVEIEKPLIAGLYGDVRELPITFDLFADGKVFTLADRWPILDRLGLGERHIGQLKAARTLFEGEMPELLDYVGSICRVNVFFTKQPDARQVWSAVDARRELIRTTSLPCNIEITHSTAHKGSGVQWLCDHTGVGLDEVIAFGDSDNDVTMLEVAGDGVAMANANDRCKAAANHMTTSCADAGVARYLRPILEGAA